MYLVVVSALLQTDCCWAVQVGDRNITARSWQQFHEALDCWTSPEGLWTARPDLPPLYSDIYSNDRHLNTKVYSACGPVAQRKGLEYVWTPPSTCAPMRSFSPAGMCKVMRGRQLIIAGDSLSLHHYEATLNAMGNRTVYGSQYDDHDAHHWSQPYGCAEHGQLPFSVTYLSWNSITFRSHFESLRLLSKESHGAVVVANWGAFFQSNESVKAHMSDIFHFVNSLSNITFIFRSSNMAHLQCDGYTVPDNVLHLPAPHPQHGEWAWDRFPFQNAIWKDYIDRHQPGGIFMNIMNMVAKRPDQHPGKGDCLHYCLPGPHDTWVRLTYSILQLIEELALQDIVQLEE